MARVLVATVPYEGAYFSISKDPAAPIRFYSDRWVEDDIAAKHTGSIRRKRLTRNEFRLMRKAAIRNYKEGRVS